MMKSVRNVFPEFGGRSGESGNAVIYVLIVIALFTALSFLMSRQSSTSEPGTLSGQQAELAATQILQVSMQIKQAVDSMVFSGTTVAALNFVRPGAAGFETAPNGVKVFHPDGGGVILTPLPEGAGGVATDPASGWYLGRFNNVEWTPTAAQDVILTAYDIAQPVCALINGKLTGSNTIPTASVPLRNVLVDDADHGGSNADFMAANCAACEGKPSLCIENQGGGSWSFYSLIETQ